MSNSLLKINDFFKQNQKVALAFSGGVDSCTLLFLAKQNGADVKPYFVKSAFQPFFELDDALSVCDSFAISLEVIELDILSNPIVASNPADRCYFCKKMIFKSIIQKAQSDGYNTVIDGTNATDDIADRPGYKALGEYGVISSLRLCGIGKKEIRQIAKENNIKVWNKPSYSCLATRIPFNREITDLLLETVEKAENELMKMGFSDFRIRLVNDDALIQLTENDLPLFNNNKDRVISSLKKYFNNVFLDTDLRISNG